jgi:hypothetical protein
MKLPPHAATRAIAGSFDMSSTSDDDRRYRRPPSEPINWIFDHAKLGSDSMAQIAVFDVSII